MVIARNGMAATSQPLATAAAIRVLQQGGNAIDAAIAADAVLGVVEPMSCGIGGDLFAIVWDAKTKKLYGLNASGRSPAKADLSAFKAKGLESIPTHGPLSWSVPGCVDGWDQLRQRFGTKPWAELLAPAIEYAEEGFPVSEIIAADWNASAKALSRIPTSAACYLPGGRAPGVGDVFRNPGLAKSLKAIVDSGRDAYYKGPIAEAIVGYSDSHEGPSPSPTSPSTPRRGSSRSRPTIGATTSGSSPPTARGSRCSRCSTCWKRTTSRAWGRNRRRRST
jgi:gamma-glutamyltranspeptidase/glutathione hydrolase